VIHTQSVVGERLRVEEDAKCCFIKLSSPKGAALTSFQKVHKVEQGSKYWISGSYQMGFFHIGGYIGDTRSYRTFISDTIYKEILITKSWFSVIDIIYRIKMM